MFIFVVKCIKSYLWDKVFLNEIFGYSNKCNLNLIMCIGMFDCVEGIY